MMYICFVVVLLAVSFLCIYIYLYRSKSISSDQKLINKVVKMNKMLDKRIEAQNKNMEKSDESMEQIRRIIKENDEKPNRMRNDIEKRK